jgi:D-xylose transport system substrate-binding protein
MDQITNVMPFVTPGRNTLNTILLTPQPINVSTLNIVLDSGWITKATLCQGVPPGSVAVCN